MYNNVVCIAQLSCIQRFSPVLEYIYPSDLKPEKHSFPLDFPSIDFTKGIADTKDEYKECISLLPQFAFADMNSSMTADVVYMILPASSGRLLYAISYYRRFNSFHIKGNTKIPITLWKSICLLFKIPFFGAVSARLKPAVLSHFLNITNPNMKFLEDAYHHINNSLSANNFQYEDLFFDLNNSEKSAVLTFIPVFLSLLVKIILLERKIVFYSKSALVASSSILAVLGLIPAALSLGFPAKNFGRDYLTWQKYGFPLRIFHENYPLMLLCPQNMIGVTSQKSGFLIGITNFDSYEILDKPVDLLVDLDRELLNICNYNIYWITYPTIHEECFFISSLFDDTIFKDTISMAKESSYLVMNFIKSTASKVPTHLLSLARYYSKKQNLDDSSHGERESVIEFFDKLFPGAAPKWLKKALEVSPPKQKKSRLKNSRKSSWFPFMNMNLFTSNKDSGSDIGKIKKPKANSSSKNSSSSDEFKTIAEFEYRVRLLNEYVIDLLNKAAFVATEERNINYISAITDLDFSELFNDTGPVLIRMKMLDMDAQKSVSGYFEDNMEVKDVALSNIKEVDDNDGPNEQFRPEIREFHFDTSRMDLSKSNLKSKMACEFQESCFECADGTVQNILPARADFRPSLINNHGLNNNPGLLNNNPSLNNSSESEILFNSSDYYKSSGSDKSVNVDDLPAQELESTTKTRSEKDSSEANLLRTEHLYSDSTLSDNGETYSYKYIEKYVPNMLAEYIHDIQDDFSYPFIKYWVNSKNAKHFIKSHQLKEFSMPATCSEVKSGKIKVFTYSNGDEYRGTTKNMQRDGYGKYISKNGTIYEGNWKKDKRHGYGVLQSMNPQLKYSGNWKNNVKSGFGHLKTEMIEYWGQFEDNKFNGSGVLVQPNGTTYEGEFKNSMYHGQGKLLERRMIKLGEFNQGCLLKEASIIYPTGSLYIGSIELDIPDGLGYMCYDDDHNFHGTWIHGIRFGQGVLTCQYKTEPATLSDEGQGFGNDNSDESPSNVTMKLKFASLSLKSKQQAFSSCWVIEGYWRDDIIDLEHQLNVQFPNGDKYIGYMAIVDKSEIEKLLGEDLVENMSDKVILPEGKGILRSALTGDVYDGEWHLGFCHGQGNFLFKEGLCWNGNFTMNLYSSSGTLTLFNGDMLDLNLKFPISREQLLELASASDRIELTDEQLRCANSPFLETFIKYNLYCVKFVIKSKSFNEIFGELK